MRALTYISYLDDTGYGIAGKTFLKALLSARYAIHWRPMDRSKGPYSLVHTPKVRSGYAELDALYRNPVDAGLVVVHAVPPLWHPHIQEARKSGQVVVGYTVWETDKLPRQWVECINEADAVLVPSQWNKSVFEASGVRIPIGVLPHCAQFKGEAAHAPPGFPARIPSDAYVFLCVSEWNARKIPYKTIEAFYEAFPGRQDVCLVVKTSALDYTRYTRTWRNGFRRRPQRTAASAQGLLKGKPPHPSVLVLPQHLPHVAMQYLYTRCDAYLSIVRSEGWGMGAYEAAWYGRPVVATAWGGQLDFLPPTHSCHIGYNLIPVAPQEAWPEYEADQRWAEPHAGQMVDAMRSLADHRSASAQMGARLREATRLHFSDAAVVRQFEAILSRLQPHPWGT